MCNLRTLKLVISYFICLYEYVDLVSEFMLESQTVLVWFWEKRCRGDLLRQMKVFLPWCLRFWKCSIWINNAMVLFGSLWVIASDRFAVTGESPSFGSSVQPKAISRIQNVLQTDFPTNTISLSCSASLSFPISVILTLDFADAVPEFIYHFSFPQTHRCV